MLKNRERLTSLTPLLIFAWVVFIYACNSSGKERKNKAPKDDWDASIIGSFSAEEYKSFDPQKIDSFEAKHPDFSFEDSVLHHFYSNRNYSYAWFDKYGLIEQAGYLINRISNLKQEGIYTEPLYKKELDSLVALHENGKEADLTLEIMLTAQYFDFARKVWEGMGTQQSEASEWFVPRKKIAAEDYLNSLIKDPEKIEDLPDEPINQQYQRLKAKLKEYTELANNEKWEPLIPKEKSYKKGTTDSLLMAVKERLHALGDLPEDDKNSEFTDALEKAVASFQYRHGLDSDGVLGKSTFEQLNIPPSERLRTIIVNMERARWVPYQVKSKYLVVNIPAYELYVYQNDSLLWTSNVVVGKGVHQTVVFSGDVKYVVFSPYWNIPNSIVRNEILPALEKNPNYLKQHNMEITDNKGSLPTIRQKPGPSNSLGLVKFLFPNNHNIYLHDTPAKSLFNETDRAFSHGCIRVQQPVRLAEFLLEEKGDWSTERIEKAMHQGEEQTITLDQTVPVFIIYFTSFVDKDGAIHFRKDIYNRDQRLANMIMKN